MDVFPFGTHVYREPCLDLEAVLRDLPLLKRLRLQHDQDSGALVGRRAAKANTISPAWSRLIKRAGELDLGIYLGLTMEQAPHVALAQVSPIATFVYCGWPVAQSADAVHHPHGWQARPLLGSSLACALPRAFHRRAGADAGPPYPNIWAWNTFQEIGFWPNEAGKLGFCYCPHTLARFREWLREKYGTLAALNATWQLNHAHWDEVEPPRREEPLAPFIDWRYFMDDVYPDAQSGIQDNGAARA